VHTQKITVTQPEGLHARPAAQFVKLANRFQSTVKVRHNGREANGKSIMAVMSLGASAGAEVELDVQGNDAQQARAELTTFLGSRGVRCRCLRHACAEWPAHPDWLLAALTCCELITNHRPSQTGPQPRPMRSVRCSAGALPGSK
jgi:phosphotransferase system HPr (HPr) family protein